MNDNLEKRMRRYSAEHRKRKKWRTTAISLCVIVALGISYLLINPASTMSSKAYCGHEEHTEHDESCYKEIKTLKCKLSEEGHAHTDACYETVLTCKKKETDGHKHNSDCYDYETVLVCENTEEGHEHTDECYELKETLKCDKAECEAHHHDENCYKQKVVCGKKESEPHKHTEECYKIKKELVCKKEMHKHTLQCFSNPKADVETAAVWERTLDDVKLTGKWNEDVISIAESQLGYQESKANYEVQEDGKTTKGYTRYGDWYGVPYGDWCAMFCSFCMNYAGVNKKAIPFESCCQDWIKTLKQEKYKLYHKAGKYSPEPGDLVFFDWDSYDAEHLEKREADHVGIVAELICDQETKEITKIKTIEGNSGNTVRYNTYDITNSEILGYGEMPENPNYVEKTEEEKTESKIENNIDDTKEENTEDLTETETTTEADATAETEAATEADATTEAEATTESGEPVEVEGDTGILSDWNELESAEELSSGKEYDEAEELLGKDVPFELYDICKEENAEVPEEGVQVYLPVEKEMRVFGIEDGEVVWHDGEFITIDGQGYMAFTAYHFSEYGVAGTESKFNFPENSTGQIIGTKYDETATLKNGDTVIIQSVNSGHYLSDDSSSSDSTKLSLKNVSQSDATRWTVKVVTSNRRSTTYLQNEDGKYLNVGNETASLSNDTSATPSFASDASTWQISRTISNGSGYYTKQTTYYLNDWNGEGTKAGGYTEGASDDENSRWMIYTVSEGEIASDLWVRCNDTSDFTTSDMYMIVHGDASFALGNATNNGAGVTITSAGTIGNETHYIISGSGSDDRYQWKFSNISNGNYTLRNVSDSSKLLNLGNDTIINTSGSANTITNPGTDHEVWQIKNSYNRYLRYIEGTFQRSERGQKENSYMYIYKKVNTTASQLAVQKVVPTFNALVDQNTEFTFRLVRADTNNVSNATAVSRAAYDLYDYEGDNIGTSTLDSNGTFKLKAGQTALFTNPDTSKFYFVQEAVSEDIKTVTATVNGNTVNVTTASKYHTVPVTFSTDHNSLVQVKNTPVEPEPGLKISLDLDKYDVNVNADSVFEFLVTDKNGVPSEFTNYVIGNNEPVNYNPDNPRIPIHPGETVCINGLAGGESDQSVTYVVHQYYGDNATYINHSRATVNGKTVIVTDIERANAQNNEREESYFKIEYSGSASAIVENVLRSSGNTGGGSGALDLKPKVPDHHKYIDAFRDGDDNPETDLDDKARENKVNDAVIEDLYRLYLDVGPESAYDPIDVLFVVDSSTSMSGFTGQDATDIKGNSKAWRCFALDTLLLGQGNERSGGSAYSGKGTQSEAQHQRKLYDNGLISKIADMDPENQIAITRFSKTAVELLPWTTAKNIKDENIVDYSNVSGTNYVAAMKSIVDYLGRIEVVNDGHKKVVVYISDGLPTYFNSTVNDKDQPEYADLKGEFTVGEGSEKEDEYKATEKVITQFKSNDLIKGLINSKMLDIYTVAVGTGVFSTESGLDARALLNSISTEGSTIESVDFRELLRILDSKITNGYGHFTDMKITDQLSEDVDFYANDLDMLIEKIPENGTGKEILYENGALTTTGEKYIKKGGVEVNYDEKTVSVDFLDEYREEGGFIYRISFNVETTQTAYDKYAANVQAKNPKGGYDGKVGDGSENDKKTDYVANGNYTSSGLPGFRSNQAAVLEYTQNIIEGEGETHHVEYLHPVIQVWTADLKIKKAWSDGKEKHTDDVVLVDVWMKAIPENTTVDPGPVTDANIRTDGTKIKEGVALNANNDWTYTVTDLPRGYYYYITEQTGESLSNYTQSYTPDAVAVPHNYTGDMNFEVDVTNTKTKGNYLVLRKTDMAGEPLKGAEFKLYSDAEHKNEVHAGELIRSGEDGIFTPENFILENGEYYLVETVTPPGYNTLKDHVEIVVTASGVTAQYENKPLTVEKTEDEDAVVYTLAIANSSGYVLPETGGFGTKMFTLCGLLLVAVALYGYVMRRKKERGVW